MILRPRYADVKIILYYLGKVIIGIGILMSVPLIVSFIFKEWDATLDYLIGIAASLSFGLLLIRLFYTKEELGWMHGMVVVALSWIVAAFLSAIPLYLSGHFLSFLDACFDAMSGYATTGLTIIKDLDHLSNAHNMWRHFIMYIGGQGIIVVALTFLIKAGGTFSMYVGEARDEKILPNVINTARFIWLVSLVYLAIGTIALMIAGIYEGMPVLRAFLHGMWIFMAAWDTGGFTPQSQNILYYHSMPFEIITISIMVLGALNFKLHYAVWTGNRKEIFKNIESVTIFISILTMFSLCAVGLARLGIYPEAVSLFRKGCYQIISGHVGTGYSTIYARQFVLEWGGLAMIATTIAMAFGGCACSTAGGIKALRIGIIFKALRQDIKKIMVPSDSIAIQKFHHIKDMVLQDQHVRSAALIALCYLLLYLVGALIGMFCG
ncbi:MAG: TrkH family potassium uptake protein, partial [Candidatus Omnitrophica bacterium]|nr:TrkH family potassium uptake protein [Candidatus Omnitrophota bacterium]